MNNKVLSFVLVVGIASTWFVGISAANSGTTSTPSEKSSWMNQELKKIHKGHQFGKRKGLKNLTEDEKLALESMSDEERKAFFQQKKEEKKANKEASKAVLDALIAGETLSADQEANRLEMLAKIEEGKHQRNNADIIAKILAWDALSEAEQIELQEMQEKKAEREAQKALLEPIKAKLDAGEELTDDEQSLLDEAKSQKKWKRGHGKRGER